jgi:hypothetical protein
MFLAFLLGLTGSLGHCVGMCGGVVILLGRKGIASGRRLFLAHVGRVTTYSLLGLGAGAAGHAIGRAFPDLSLLQGAFALLVAGVTVYLALALLGRVPPPDRHLSWWSRKWGEAMRRLPVAANRRSATEAGANDGPSPTGDTASSGAAFVAGMLWGLLPCGLVLTALLTAAVTASPVYGALTMFAFGLGTWPALLGVGWLARRGLPRTSSWPRQAAAVVVLLFGTQMALRGLAAWGWVNHVHVGRVMIW